MNDYHIELLAPAGNVEAFKGAIHAGADAVYLGGAKFGARAYADNFTTEELISCIRYAHIFGRKVYLTVNTLMKDQELQELYDYLAPFYEAGLDAVIVQDLGVFQFIKRNFPDMELHVSTQMTITGAYGASFLKELGASRIVPARELSLKELEYMKAQTGLEIETFIHGAMCYCYSGQCLFSSILGGRSGNRGRCAQPCRLPYSIEVNGKHRDECYPLSLKDMCTLEHIGEFMDAGIDSFKIEGRMKKPEYAAGVTAIYRKYIDRKIKHPEKTLQFGKKDIQDLTKLYIRSDRQDGYYYKQNGADMVTLDSPAYSGSDEELLARIRTKYIETSPKKPISIYASFFCGSEATATCICEDISVTVTGNTVEPAKNQPTTAEAVEKQLRKLGDTCFEAEIVDVSTDDLGFYPVKAINELRRIAVKNLEDELITSYGLPASRSKECPECVFDHSCLILNDNESEQQKSLGNEYMDQKKCVTLNCQKHDCLEIDGKNNTGWSVSVTTLEQLQAVERHASIMHPERIYIESELFFNNPDLKLPPNVDIYIALPYVMRRKDEHNLKTILQIAKERPEIKGMLFRNLEEYSFLMSSGYKGKLAADAGIYIWNQEARNFWQDRVDSLTCPVELNRREWQEVFGSHPIEKIVYGRIPMMVTANCIAKTGDKCLHGKESSFAYLTDRYKKKFPVIIQCNYCMNIILNSVPLSLHNKESLNWYDSALKRISFTVEHAAEVASVLAFFAGLGTDSTKQLPFTEYTTGHEKRGVE